MVAETKTPPGKEHVPGTNYSTDELMLKWGYSRASVIRLIKDESGVLKLRIGPKRARTCYSVPEEVERRIYRRLSEGPLLVRRSA